MHGHDRRRDDLDGERRTGPLDRAFGEIGCVVAAGIAS
jgi:hypothetical protein